MDDREMLEKIAESAQGLSVPEDLKPEQIKRQLEKRPYRKWIRYRALAAAACLCLCFGGAGLAYQNYAAQRPYDRQTVSNDGMEDSGNGSGHMPAGAEDGRQTVSNDGMEDSGNMPAGAEDDGAGSLADDAGLARETPVRKLGNMYTLASDYGEVYDVLEKTVRKQMEWKQSAQAESVREDGIYNGKDMMSASGMKQEEASDDAADSGGQDYSSTNLQVEGVDESDFVKTDGSFIYVVQETQIQVLDVRDKIPAVAGTIRPQMDEDTDRICEMYVADGVLTVILQTEETALEEKTEMEDLVQYVHAAAVTKVVTYDLTDPLKPLLKETTQQDGWYQTSRKIGNRLYLFTNQMLGSEIADGMPRDEAMKDDGQKSWIPAVDGKAVRWDCIYLPKEGNRGLLMTSIDLSEHNKVLDMKLLVNNYGELYVTSKSVYLYECTYVNEAFRTRIARFTLEEDGQIRAKAAKTVKGNITDTFGIHERNGYLQVLTSLTNQEPWENRVYVLDENMEVAGKLTGLAKGEQIYAARFAGETGYFVTYRNTDPLFTVDFSDPQNPKVIGELKVTGFSEYLHFWSDNRLLGIGYETDPQNGGIIGVKLSMFDISDPGKVKEEAKLVLKGTEHCEGMYDYKAVLAEQKKNLIAFTTETYQNGFQKYYHVYSYKNGKFVERVKRTLSARQNGYDSRRWRSVYVKDRLYLVSEKKIIVYDLSDGCKETGKLKYGWEENS